MLKLNLECRNAKLGEGFREYAEGVIGKHGAYTVNDIRDLLEKYSEENGLSYALADTTRDSVLNVYSSEGKIFGRNSDAIIENIESTGRFQKFNGTNESADNLYLFMQENFDIFIIM